MKNKTLIGNGFIWMTTSIFVVILPTALVYIFELISQEKLPDMKDYFDSILLIIFSISWSLFAICCDNRSGSLNIKFIDIVKIISFVIGSIFGAYHFYIIGIGTYKISDPFLLFTAIILVIYSILGFIISHHHNLYEDSIESAKNNIKNEKMKNKTNKKA